MNQKMNIALCLNANYLMPTLTCMVSLIENNVGPIDFYLLHADLSNEDIAHLQKTIIKYGAPYSVIPIHISDSQFESYPTLGRSKEAYFRLLIPKVLPPHLDRCLYLDGDIIAQKSIADFYATDFTGNALVVCEDMGETLLFHKERHSLLNIPHEYRYFNSGVLLFNLNYFREQFDSNLFFDYAQKNLQKLKFLDQDILNALCYDKVTFAPSYLYNYMEILINPLITNTALHKAVLVHFIQKPWKYTYTGANASYWWKYAKKHYPYQYLTFLALNTLYTTILKIILIFISINTLKNFKKRCLK